MNCIVKMWANSKEDLEGKAIRFKLQFIQEKLESLIKELRSELIDTTKIGIIVFPDYLFFDESTRELCDKEDYLKYQQLATSFLESIPVNILAVIGAMRWFDKQQKRLSVTSMIVYSGKLKTYYKKYPTENESELAAENGGKFNKGDTLGRFSWNGLACGIEICQDHEERALISEVSNTLNIHILLSFGQCGRNRNMALDHSGGLFIQCERESSQYWKVKKGNDIPTNLVRLISYKHHRASKQYFTEKMDIMANSREGISTYICDISVKNNRRIRHVIPEIKRQARSWLPDASTSKCSGCKTDFSFFTRKHHCRKCGYIFCHNCSNNKFDLTRRLKRPGNYKIETGEVRVCYNYL